MTTPTDYAARLRRSFESLLRTLALLDPEEIEQGRMENEWTPKALLAHVAFWDDVQRRRMEAALQGTVRTQHPSAGDNDERAALDDARSYDEVLATAEAARARLIDFAASLDDEALGRSYPEEGRTLSLDLLLAHMVEHTRRHTRDLYAYCGSMRRWDRARFRRLLDEQHCALLDSVAGLTEEEILTTRLAETSSETWTLRDQLVHLLAWSEYAYRVVEAWPSVDSESIRDWLAAEGENEDDINARLLERRAGMTMIDIADMLATWHRRLLRKLDGLGDDDLQSYGSFGWGEEGALSLFLYGICMHQAEHAQEIWERRPA